MSESENTEESIDPCANIDAKRAKAKAARERVRSVQRAKDLEAIMALEEEMGLELETLETQGRVVEGLPVVVAVRAPSKTEYARYAAIVRREKEGSIKRSDAIDQLARVCIVYPPQSETRDAFFEAFPGALVSAVPVVTRLAELAREDEKKG